jgi:hypothetical protein
LSCIRLGDVVVKRDLLTITCTNRGFKYDAVISKMLREKPKKKVTNEVMALNVMPLRVLTVQAVKGFIGRIKTKATTA